MASTTSAQTATETLALLESRLHRLDYALNGHHPTPLSPTNPLPQQQTDTPASKAPASARLRDLERTLATLKSKSPAAAAVLDLQTHHPHLFHPATSPTGTPPPLHPTALASLLLAHTSLLQNLSHHHLQLQSTPIPSPSPHLTKAIELRPQIERVQAKQREQMAVVAELRTRSAVLVERWVEEGVLGMGEWWAGWEERLRECEVLVRRVEARGRREREGLV